MTISIETKKSKTITRLIANIADENNLKYILEGDVGTDIDQALFNKIIWLPGDITFYDGNQPSVDSPVTWKAFKKRLDAEMVNVEAIHNRVNEYPSIQDQLDMIFKDIDAWRDTIQSIKDKYPKQ